ncbi:MAG: hypothetical protein JSW20_04320 [Nitrospiraceae bacterium]|nr:MAG: hypothetical protein JSW20_04320 [Nitrospiraceae bacterium]
MIKGADFKTDSGSQHHGIPGLFKERPEVVVTINITDAAGYDQSQHFINAQSVC